MLARQHYAAAAAASALALCALALIVFHPHDDATELLMKGKKKAHGLAVKYYLDKGLSGKMGHKVFTQLMSDGLQVTDIQEGKGVEAKVGDIVKVQYSGKLANGKEFDKGTISFPLGRHKVIKGWDQGLMHMKTGGLRMLHIPPALAYGKKGNAKIPADSTLLFSVKLLHVQKAGAKAAVGGKKPFWKHSFKGHAHTLSAQRKAAAEKKAFLHHKKLGADAGPQGPKFSLSHII